MGIHSYYLSDVYSSNTALKLRACLTKNADRPISYARPSSVQTQVPYLCVRYNTYRICLKEVKYFQYTCSTGLK